FFRVSLALRYSTHVSYLLTIFSFCVLLSLSLIFFFFFFFYSYGDHRDLHSFPTRRSSDLGATPYATKLKPIAAALQPKTDFTATDRKSTRLNSSHQIISYAVFCLKKKKKIQKTTNI